MQSNLIQFEDSYLVPLYLALIFFVGYIIKYSNIKKHAEYKYFLSGLLLKILGVSLFALVYIFYYEGGDTMAYFQGSKAIFGLFKQSFTKGYHVLFNTDSVYNSISSFNNGTGWPPGYMWKDPKTFSVCRFSFPMYALGSQSFLVTSFLSACFSYIGVWKIYRLFNILYPGNYKVFAYLILFLPSLIFWGGGIMKDSFVLGATCWISYNFYKIFILRKQLFWNLVFFIFNLFLILNIKAYIVLSLIPGMLLWLNSFSFSIIILYYISYWFFFN